MSVFAALTMIVVVGAYASGSALAHNGHSHGPSVQAKVAADLSSADEVSLALAELAIADVSRDDAMPAERIGLVENGAPARNSTPPCEGHCCTMGGMPCCGYLPDSLELMTLASLMDLGSLAPGDSIRDGLEPEFILRPPKSFA